MVMMIERPRGQVSRIPPLPPFATAEEILADALPLIEPPSRMSVTDAAERHIRLQLRGTWIRFDRMVAPYMVEPADATQSRRFRTCCFVGPAQSAKTVMLQTVALHSVMCDPSSVHIVHMTRDDANRWVEEKLDPIIYNSPDLYDRLGKGRDDSTFSRKRFKGMRLTIGYPVANQLSGRTYRMVLLTDYDHMPQRLGGAAENAEGSPWTMALERTKTFMSRGMVVLESTPAFPAKDPNWTADPSRPHALPPVAGGIVPIYNEGTRGRWYWDCPDCATLFEPRFDRLVYDATLDPAEAAAGAMMCCPHCGSLIEHRHKVGLNRRALAGHGGWLHESARIDDAGRRVLCRLGDADLRQTSIASWALNGAAAAFASWYDLVEKFEAARRKFEETGDDLDCRQVSYTGIGLPYARRADDLDGLSVQVLREAGCEQARGTCPDWTRFVTVSVDVNGSWFAVMVTAWGLDGQRSVVDRFDLREPPETAPRARDHEGRMRAVEPGRYLEDAEVLKDLGQRAWPVQGSGWALRPVAVVVDFNGPPGWSDNAERLWRDRRAAGQGRQWFLSIGRGGFAQASRVWLETPERGSNGKSARSIKLLNVAVDRLKDSVLAALRRLDGGAMSFALPRWLEDERIEELLAESRGERGYEKRRSAQRNETLDLAVQAQAAAELFGLGRLDADNPPNWAVLDDRNAHAVWQGETPAPPAAPVSAGPAGRGQIKWLMRKG